PPPLLIPPPLPPPLPVPLPLPLPLPLQHHARLVPQARPLPQAPPLPHTMFQMAVRHSLCSLSRSWPSWRSTRLVIWFQRSQGCRRGDKNLRLFVPGARERDRKVPIPLVKGSAARIRGPRLSCGTCSQSGESDRRKNCLPVYPRQSPICQGR